MQSKLVSVLLFMTSLAGATYALDCVSFNRGDEVLKLVRFRMMDRNTNRQLYSLPLSGHSGIYVYLDVDVKDRLPSDATFSLSLSFPRAWADMGFLGHHAISINCQSLVPKPLPSCSYSKLDCSQMEKFLTGSSFDCPLAPGQYRNLLGRDHIFPVPNLWTQVPAFARPFVKRAGGTGKLVISSGGRPIACVEASVVFHR
ncbi:uncharacterized protein LOC116616128 [Nematostella vectensis]|uniref:uncharacterized protein LOC116616128 n=1 Tax=Nematostella vectensis TaxID=45351 RepID=UPI001390285D|nr:uncharacterized protein LOC116616128 [Nematostella vectensis]